MSTDVLQAGLKPREVQGEGDLTLHYHRDLTLHYHRKNGDCIKMGSVCGYE